MAEDCDAWNHGFDGHPAKRMKNVLLRTLGEIRRLMAWLDDIASGQVASGVHLAGIRSCVTQPVRLGRIFTRHVDGVQCLRVAAAWHDDVLPDLTIISGTLSTRCVDPGEFGIYPGVDGGILPHLLCDYMTDSRAAGQYATARADTAIGIGP